MIRAALALVLTLSLTALSGGPALAHRVNVFASVEEGTVTVEAKFSTGRIPVSGEVRVEDASGVTVATFPLGAGGVTEFPLDGLAHEGGLSITVTTGDAHEGYWLLTPADIAAGTEGS